MNSPLNNTQTLASSANDMVSYYSRALQGGFFRSKETLDEFRRILSLGDAIWLVPVPFGVSAFVKGGSIDVPGFHPLCVPGGMLVTSRWVYFCFTINWYASAETDPGTVAAFAPATSRALRIVKQKLDGKERRDPASAGVSLARSGENLADMGQIRDAAGLSTVVIAVKPAKCGR